MKKRVFALLLTTVVFLLTLPIAVSANSPGPSPWYVFRLSELPEGTVYVDLLIQLPESDPQYEAIVSKNVKYGFSEDAQIISYCEDGFRSYTYHYRDARSQIRVDGNGCVVFFADDTTIYYQYSVAEDHHGDIESRGKIRLAMLDKDGNILQVSKSLSLKPKGLLSYSLGSFSYDASRDKLDVDSHDNTWIIILFLALSAGGIVMTCYVEWLVAQRFEGIKTHSKLIIGTNIVSQILMRVGQIILLAVLGWLTKTMVYFWTVFILEALVYLCEFLFYSNMMHEVPWKRCMLYTVCANTASALAGLLLLDILT